MCVCTWSVGGCVGNVRKLRRNFLCDASCVLKSVASVRRVHSEHIESGKAAAARARAAEAEAAAVKSAVAAEQMADWAKSLSFEDTAAIKAETEVEVKSTFPLQLFEVQHVSQVQTWQQVAAARARIASKHVAQRARRQAPEPKDPSELVDASLWSFSPPPPPPPPSMYSHGSEPPPPPPSALRYKATF